MGGCISRCVDTAVRRYSGPARAAVNKKEIVDSYYNGNAELFAYPEHPEYVGYFEPLESMPDSVKELFAYNPDKAKKLLAEAGYPDGFTFKVQVCSCSPEHADLLPLVAGYLEQIGVKMEIQPMEYGAFLSAMTTQTNAPGYFMGNGHTNPTTTLRKNFVMGQSGILAVERSGLRKDGRGLHGPDEQARDGPRDDPRSGQAPYLWLPAPYSYTAWWRG